MRRRATLVAALAAIALAPQSARAASFDGTWSVTQECEPAPGGARGFKWLYDATVKDGRLVGQYGTRDQPSSLTLTGRINPDGTATLTASGLNGKSDYTVGFGQPGSKFSYPVSARFVGTRGAGLRTQGRTCHFTFRKA
ncbi:hypothetical protein [Reyranella sp.]|uniref:hypothetical protein n=1 Tax=Reyranella sp. TaxID=1929291 RepID=UPI003BA89A90